MGADLAHMQSISKFGKEIRFLLGFIGIFSKYAKIVPLKDKKGTNMVNAFQKVSDKSEKKLNKLWVGKGKEFYNISMKSCLEKNNIEMYSTHNEGKSVATRRFSRGLKTKI